MKMRTARHKSAFTLVELLVVMSIITILIILAFAAYGAALRQANKLGCMARMHQLGIAFTTYAADHDAQLPGRVVGAGNDKWPVLLLPYVGGGPKSYVDPGDPVANAVPLTSLVSDNGNNSSFFFNGFNDLGFYTNPSLTVRLSNLGNLSNLILLGQKINGSTQYYMDFVEPPHGNQNDVLNKTAYFNGSNYVFADGSARFLYGTDPGNTHPDSDYSDSMWLVNPNWPIPKL